jgi:multidrug resistance efflux pump
MDLLLILTYAAICYGIFKVFKIPVNGYTLLTAVLGGVFLLGFLLLAMNYNHPFTKEARFFYFTTPIVPTVSGRVVEVVAKPGQHLKAGDVLFRIEDTTYKNAVAQKRAALADAEQAALQLKAALQSAQQRVEVARAERNAALDAFQRAEKLLKSGVIAQAEFQQRREQYQGSEAALSSAQAESDRAALEAGAAIEGVNTDVARLQAELATEEFNLSETTVRAPTDGTVLQLFLREGMMAVPLPLRPVMIFQHDEPPILVASFLQNSAQRVEEGSDAEVILPAVPGRFFKAKVEAVGAVIPEGQLQPSGTLVSPESIQSEGRVMVRVKFEEDVSRFHIVPGSTGNVAIYSHHMHHLGILRKVLLRMKSWMNFVFSDGHGSDGHGTGKPRH